LGEMARLLWRPTTSTPSSKLPRSAGPNVRTNLRRLIAVLVQLPHQLLNTPTSNSSASATTTTAARKTIYKAPDYFFQIVSDALMRVDYPTLETRPVADRPSWCDSTEPPGGVPRKRP